MTSYGDGDQGGRAKAPRKVPFGLQRRQFIAIRIALVLTVVLLGVTLHHHGVVYDVIRGVYLVIIVALIAWRINARRHSR